jgi:hypothetical protein
MVSGFKKVKGLAKKVILFNHYIVGSIRKYNNHEFGVTGQAAIVVINYESLSFPYNSLSRIPGFCDLGQTRNYHFLNDGVFHLKFSIDPGHMRLSTCVDAKGCARTLSLVLSCGMKYNYRRLVFS